MSLPVPPDPGGLDHLFDQLSSAEGNFESFDSFFADPLLNQPLLSPSDDLTSPLFEHHEHFTKMDQNFQFPQQCIIECSSEIEQQLLWDVVDEQIPSLPGNGDWVKTFVGSRQVRLRRLI